MTLRPTDFRLTFSKNDFFWANERRPGLPVLRWPCGALCEPVTAFFGYSFEVGRVATSSMKDEAYALREWLAFLMSRSREWYEPDDLMLRCWRQSFEAAIKAKQITKARVERKIQVVFDFYRLLHKALPLDEKCVPRKALVSVGGPITQKELITPKRGIWLVWSGAEPARGGRHKRPTPDEAQVARLLTWLRAKSHRGEIKRSGENTELLQVLEGERNWLLGRCAEAGGLRAHELAALNVGDIALALDRAGVNLPPEGLDAIANSPMKRSIILEALDTLQARRIEVAFVEIIGKGGSPRRAPFGLDLVRDILEVGIWTVRHQQIRTWNFSDHDIKENEGIFLSFKTQRSLTAGAVGDIFKLAFRECEIRGSGHRLRAHFATMMAIKLADRNMALHGFQYNQTVRNLTLVQLAEALGHASVTTTVAYYVDLALHQQYGISRRRKRDALGALIDTIIKSRASLTASDLELLELTVDAIASAGGDSLLSGYLKAALDDPRVVPPRSKKTPERKPEGQSQPVLRLVK